MEISILKNSSKCWRIAQQKPIQYDIIRYDGLFKTSNNILFNDKNSKGLRRLIVVDHTVCKFFSFKIHEYFWKRKIQTKIIPIKAGENNKSIENYLALLRELDAFPINRRNEPVIAIGGGVITDLVGFVASTYRRGIPHIYIPTTLMGYIDAALGIKTGINFQGHKNRVGTFAPPQKVILDKTFLKTLSERHLLNGIGEILKLGIIKSSLLFCLLENHGKQCIDSKFQDDTGNFILESAVESIIEELAPNLFEENLERPADFGHTFSGFLEMQEELNLLHGEAVVIDCIFCSFLAYNRNLLRLDELKRILTLVQDLNLFNNPGDLNPKLLWESLIERSYHRNGLQRQPLPSAIGEHIFINDIQFEEILAACYSFKEWIYQVYPQYESISSNTTTGETETSSERSKYENK